MYMQECKKNCIRLLEQKEILMQVRTIRGLLSAAGEVVPQEVEDCFREGLKTTSLPLCPDLKSYAACQVQHFKNLLPFKISEPFTFAGQSHLPLPPRLPRTRGSAPPRPQGEEDQVFGNGHREPDQVQGRADLLRAAGDF